MGLFREVLTSDMVFIIPVKRRAVFAGIRKLGQCLLFDFTPATSRQTSAL